MIGNPLRSSPGVRPLPCAPARPRVRRLALTCVLGFALALLVGCAGSSRGLIPAGQAGPLLEDFQEVQEAAESGEGNCAPTDRALTKTQSDFQKLPASVDAGLRSTLRKGLENLSRRARELCAQAVNHPSSTSTTSTPPPKTTPAPKTTPSTTPTPSEETEAEAEKTTTPGGSGEEGASKTGGAESEEPGSGRSPGGTGEEARREGTG